MKAALFLADLMARTADLRQTVRHQFAALDLALLNQRPAPGSWSILECLEHLNRYSRYYSPALASAFNRAGPQVLRPDTEVVYTWLGRKSVRMMQPGNPKKQVSLKHMNPLGSRLDESVLAEFDQYQAQLLELLAQAGAANLNKRAVPVEFFRFLKLRLGEALEFVVVHEQRHVQQALRARAVLQPELAG